MHLLLLWAASLSCPVVSSASVASVFGTTETSVAKPEKGKGVTCEFTGAESRLRVEVSELEAADKFAGFAASQCQGGGETVTLKGLGSEAIACSLGTRGNVAEKVVGRVRNQAFVLFLHTTDKAADSRGVRTKIMGLAELVAGNLF